MNNKEVALKVLKLIPKTREILENTNIDIQEKDGNGNFVTNVDKKMENYLKQVILEAFPMAQIIAEESADKVKKEENAEMKFVIDPIDGTTNYTNGWPYTVSIGIVNGNELICGILYEVLKQKVYVGIKNEGVYESSINSILELKKVKQPAYNKSEIKKAVTVFDIPYGNEAFELTQKISSKLYHRGASLKTIGPISLDILKMALGQENRPNDYNVATWHVEVRAWDLAAVTCILRELGGEIIGKNGNPLSIKTLTDPCEKISFIASGNKELLNKMFEIYNEVIENN